VKTYPSGRKTFVYRYYITGKEKFISLGDYPALSLAEAIQKAQQAAINIAEPQKAVTDHATVKMLFDDYIADQKQGARDLMIKRKTAKPGARK
jgi:hypothetical protein